MRVLVAIDGSEGSFEAVRQAAALLAPAQDRVAFYYSPPPIYVEAMASRDERVLEHARRALVDAVFDNARTRLPAALRDNLETIVGSQRANHGITVAADSWNADLIVVGARGLGPIRRVLLGSVSRAVVHEATVPVLVVRPRRRPEEHFKVLMAVDSATTGERLGGLLRQFTWPAETSGRIISVVPSLFAGEIPKWLEEQARSAEIEEMSRAWVAERDAEFKAKREEMATCCASLPERLRDPQPLVTEGYVNDKILQAATQDEVDLIVVGARYQSTLSRVLVGSTSEAILSHAPCSVLVVREREQP